MVKKKSMMLDVVIDNLSIYHTQSQIEEKEMIAKGNREAVEKLWKEKYGDDFEMNFYEGD